MSRNLSMRLRRIVVMRAWLDRPWVKTNTLNILHSQSQLFYPVFALGYQKPLIRFKDFSYNIRVLHSVLIYQITLLSTLSTSLNCLLQPDFTSRSLILPRWKLAVEIVYNDEVLTLGFHISYLYLFSILVAESGYTISENYLSLPPISKSPLLKTTKRTLRIQPKTIGWPSTTNSHFSQSVRSKTERKSL